MKPLHEIATIVNGTEIVGMLLGEGMKTPRGKIAKVVNNVEFAKLVSQNKVQYFQTVNGVPVVKYTDEELKKVKKAKAVFYGEEYFNNDIRLNIEGFYKNDSLSISIITYQEMFGVPICAALIASITAIPFELIYQYKKETSATISRMADNVYMTLINPSILLSFLSRPTINYSINFDLMLNTNNIGYKKTRLTVKNVSDNEITAFVQNCMLMGLNRHIT